MFHLASLQQCSYQTGEPKPRVYLGEGRQANFNKCPARVKAQTSLSNRTSLVDTLSRVSPSFLPLYLLSSRNPSFLDLLQTPKSKQTRQRGLRWEKAEKETGNAEDARTGTTPSDLSAIDASSLAFSSTPKPQPIPNGSRESAIGSAPVRSLFLHQISFALDFSLFQPVYFATQLGFHRLV